ncbi:hypothetical protein SARC_16389, partial [Sphaeroforma arctica JP610]
DCAQEYNTTYATSQQRFQAACSLSVLLGDEILLADPTQRILSLYLISCSSPNVRESAFLPVIIHSATSAHNPIERRFANELVTKPETTQR